MSPGGHPGPGELLREHGLRPKRSWGQNFLHDASVTDRIVATLAPVSGERVVELGAGLGHLTRRLADTGASVVAVERDRDLVGVLEGLFAEDANVEILAADAKRLDLGAMRGQGEPLCLVGNLPYNVSSPILFHTLAHRHALSRAVFMVQREVAARLEAGPGTRAYGVLSVRFGLHCEVRRAFDVSPRAFLPPPRVVSSVIRLDFRARPLADPGDEEVFRRVVAAAFGQRRKKLWNALKAGRLLPEEALAAALEAAGVDGAVRAETLPIEAFAALSREFFRRSSEPA